MSEETSGKKLIYLITSLLLPSIVVCLTLKFTLDAVITMGALGLTYLILFLTYKKVFGFNMFTNLGLKMFNWKKKCIKGKFFF